MIGKTVKYSYNNRYNENVMLTGVVVGCDEKIGISIVNEDDPKDHLICLHGPSAKDYYHESYYNIIFDYIVKMINIGGTIEVKILRKIREDDGNYPIKKNACMIPCPFS